MSNLIRNGDFYEWPNGTSLTSGPGSDTTPIAGDLSFITVGASQPTVTISQQEHAITSSVKQGFPRYYLRVAPATAPALGATDKAYLSYSYTEELDRVVAPGAYGVFTFWARASTNREIVVRFRRTFGTGGAAANGSTEATFVTQPIQLTSSWRKYQVDIRFIDFPSAIYGANAIVEGRIYLQGGTTELGTNVIPWTTATVDFSQVSLTIKATDPYEVVRLDEANGGLSDKVSKTTLTTIFATDEIYGAVGDYNGSGSSSGTGTDNRAAIQAALDAAYTQGPGGVNDTFRNVSHRVVIPKGKYYITAPADGSPSLVIPLKVELDFSEAELHFDIPAKVSGSVPVGWCAIKMGQQSGLVVGKMQTVAGRDQTYGGTFYGMHLDAIRVMESDGSTYIRGGGGEHSIRFFTRGACIRMVACWNTWIENLQFCASGFGVVGSYYGNAFSSYTRYRDGLIEANNLQTSVYIRFCSFLGIHKRAVLMGVKGDLNSFVDGAAGAGGTETFESAHRASGICSVDQCAFETIAENCVFVYGQMAMCVSNCMVETAGDNGSGTGVFNADGCRIVSLSNIRYVNVGAMALHATYTAPHASILPNPDAFLFVSTTDVSPSLRDISIFNNVQNNCKLIRSDTTTGPTRATARFPVIVNYKSETATTMQGTSTYLPTPVPNQGGQVYSASTVGIGPDSGYTPNGARTVFVFSNGFTPLEPQWILADGVRKPKTNADASTNWSWNSGTGEVTMAVAPTKDIRAFY
jgi:hypothetical protein